MEVSEFQTVATGFTAHGGFNIKGWEYTYDNIPYLETILSAQEKKTSELMVSRFVQEEANHLQTNDLGKFIVSGMKLGLSVRNNDVFFTPPINSRNSGDATP